MLVGGVGAVHMGHISHMHYPLRSYDLWSKRVREREREKKNHSHPIRRENSSCALELKRVCGRLSGEISLRICRFKEQFFLCVV